MGTYVGGDDNSTSGTSFALTWPAVDAGDQALLWWTGQTGITFTAPAGFDLVEAFVANSGSHESRLYAKTCVGDEDAGSITLTMGTANKHSATLLVYRGYLGIHDFAVIDEDSGTGTHACPPVTPEIDGCAAVVAYSERLTSGTETITPPATYSKREEITSQGGGGATFLSTADDGLAAEHAADVEVSPGNWTGGDATNNSITWTVLLAPAPADIDVEAGRVTGTGTAQPLDVSHQNAIGQAVGTGTAQPLSVELVNVLNRVIGAGTARPLAVSQAASGMALFPELSLQCAFSVGANLGTMLHLDDPTRGRLDTGTLGDGSEAEPTWVELADRATEGQITVSRGSQRIDSPIVHYEAGTLTAPLANHDRALDPSNLDGPYVDETTGRTQVTAMRAVRVRATWANTVYELLQSTADGWDVEYQDPGVSITTLTATDGMKVLTGITRGAVPPVGDGETTGARINRILDSAGWPAEDRLVDDGNTIVQPTTLDGEVLAELQLVADTEIGELYVDGGGRVRFRARNALLTEERSNTSQALFGDDGNELPYVTVGVSTDDATFFNEVRVTRAARDGQEPPDEPVEQVAAATASQAQFYKKTFTPPAAPILDADDDASAYAHWLLAVASEPELRFTELTIEPAQAPHDLWPQALGRQIGDRITIRRRPPGGGLIERDCFIRGITHEFGGEEWRTKWSLQDASRHGGFLVLDEEVLGRLDENRLAY